MQNKIIAIGKRDIVKNLFYGLTLILIIGAILFFAETNFFSSELFSSFLYASALNLINYVLALVLFAFAQSSSDNRGFLKFALGGMIFRMFLVIFLIFLLIKFLNIQIGDFILTFFIIYFILLILEIRFYLKRIKRNKTNAFSGSN